jgi:hypothetical protein
MEPAICNTPSHCTPAHVAPAVRLLYVAAGFALSTVPTRGAKLAQTIGRIKPSVIGIGTFLKLSLLCVALPG